MWDFPIVWIPPVRVPIDIFSVDEETSRSAWVQFARWLPSTAPSDELILDSRFIDSNCREDEEIWALIARIGILEADIGTSDILILVVWFCEREIDYRHISRSISEIFPRVGNDSGSTFLEDEDIFWLIAIIWSCSTNNSIDFDSERERSDSFFWIEKLTIDNAKWFFRETTQYFGEFLFFKKWFPICLIISTKSKLRFYTSSLVQIYLLNPEVYSIVLGEGDRFPCEYRLIREWIRSEGWSDERCFLESRLYSLDPLEFFIFLHHLSEFWGSEHLSLCSYRKKIQENQDGDKKSEKVEHSLSWDYYFDRETSWFCVADKEFSLVDTYDMIDDREADSHTHTRITSSRLVDSVEFFFYEIDLSFGYTDTIIWKYNSDVFLGSNIATSEFCLGSSVFDKIREDIMENLDEHIFIHTDEYIEFSFYCNLLFCFFKLWNILIDEWFYLSFEREAFHMDIVCIVMGEILIFHNLFCDPRESWELCLEERNCLVIERHHPIFDSLKIALHRSDRSTDLMGDVREKVGSDIFLYTEWLVEIIDRGYKWCKLIISSVGNILKTRTIDIGIESIDDDVHWDKYPPNPEKVYPRDNNQKYEVSDEKSSEESDDESPLWSILVPASWIRKEGTDISKRALYFFDIGYSECIASFCWLYVFSPWLDIELWIFWDILEWGRYRWEFRDNLFVFVLFFFWKCTHIEDGGEFFWRERSFLFYGFDFFGILNKECSHKVVKRYNIDNNSCNYSNTCDDRNLIG